MRCFLSSFLPNSNTLPMQQNIVKTSTTTPQNSLISAQDAKNLLSNSRNNIIAKRDYNDDYDTGNVKRLFSHDLDGYDPLEEIMEEEYGFIQYDKFEQDREFGKSNNTFTFMCMCSALIFLCICCKRYYVDNFRDNFSELMHEAEDMATVATGLNSRIGRSSPGSKMSRTRSKNSMYRKIVKILK